MANTITHKEIEYVEISHDEYFKELEGDEGLCLTNFYDKKKRYTYFKKLKKFPIVFENDMKSRKIEVDWNGDLRIKDSIQKIDIYFCVDSSLASLHAAIEKGKEIRKDENNNKKN